MSNQSVFLLLPCRQKFFSFSGANHALQRTPGFGVQLPGAALVRPAQSRAVRPATKPSTCRAFASRRCAHTRASGLRSLSFWSLGPMKPLAVIGIAFLATCVTLAETRIEDLPEVPTFPVNNGPVAVENDFTRLNPYYKQRAGTFYETEYLGFSAAKLFKLLDLENRKRVGALDILRGFIYDWLDLDVRDNGRISADHHTEAVTAMNSKFRRLLSPLQYEIYEAWRDDGSGEVNRLHFLIHYDAKAAAEREAKQK